MNRLRFLMLGTLNVRGTDGQSLTPKALKLRMLLAMFIAAPNQVIPVDELVAGLWQAPPRTATPAVQVYVSKLRRALAEDGGVAAGIDVIATDAAGYVFHLDRHTCDRTDAARCRAQALDAEAAGDLSAASALLSQCLGYWRGPSLADVRVGPRLIRIAKRLDEERLPSRSKVSRLM